MQRLSPAFSLGISLGINSAVKKILDKRFLVFCAQPSAELGTTKNRTIGQQSST